MSTSIVYIPSFVAFIDVLGFSSLIARTKDLAAVTDTIAELSHAFEDAKVRIESGWSWEKEKLAVRMFSDCICISVPARMENLDAFFQLLALIQSNFVRRRICLRGAMAIGNHFANDYIIFSEGLVKAYNIESTVVKFPRIIIPAEFWSFVVSRGKEEDIIWFRNTYVWTDPVDRQMIVDYLNFMPYTRRQETDHCGRDLKNHKSFIEEALLKHADNEDLSAKYKWMAEYHNSWCSAEYPDHPELLLRVRLANGT